MRKPGRVKQAEWRSSMRSKGLREVNVWVPEDIREIVQESVREGRFESHSAAYTHAIMQVFGQENSPTRT